MGVLISAEITSYPRFKMPASVTTNLAVIGFMFLALCYFIGEQRQKIKIKRSNTLHFLTYDDIKLDEQQVAGNDMPPEIVEYSKELLMEAFSNVRNLDRIEKLVEEKLASLQEANGYVRFTRVTKYLD